MELTVRVQTPDAQDDPVLLVVAGSIDFQSRGELLIHVRAALAGAPSAVVLDLAAVTFMDSTGIGALVESAGDAEDAGVRFAIRNPSRSVERILAVTGLSDRWAESAA